MKASGQRWARAAGPAFAMAIALPCLTGCGDANGRPVATDIVAVAGRPAAPMAVQRLAAGFGRAVQHRHCQGMRHGGSASVWRRADVNGDGIADYLVSIDTLACYMHGQRVYSVFGAAVPWGLILSRGDTYVLEEFAHRADADPRLAIVDGRTAIVIADWDGRTGDRPYAAVAIGWDGAAMARLAYYDERGRRVKADGSPRGGQLAALAPDDGTITISERMWR
ncbi:MAG: hypothetical protein DI569_03410 [Sphingopyxis macrogoltabida]|uniref:Uncharacterized protein n=1 Tax=Sphingopyxis macrogoltabida TaxID=33050 RepID=A0A2W5LAY0_SPHMC|nr:MAG: hypothetical protein DI569_03410 [Sphingopyxis macrogoltabida]